ncbi:hypothetical protein BD410DRAFT_805027 [Rickenella mellea]|uniref:Uncharacterized protein n=1 Tax=Rickenella mellea TaxID=50990 RepID=A0A4Y7PZN4_9AGAM|nr:hypothetical protein BD410DRAFT_805027 [Rickenella mellea]
MSSDYAHLSPSSTPRSSSFRESAQLIARSPSPSLQQGTPRAQAFRHSTHLIPTPGVHAPRPPRVEPLDLRWWVVYPAGGFMISLGIAVLFARLGSVWNGGYHVPVKNVISFASPEFLTEQSFFPILLVAPLGWLWIAIDWEVKCYHPYIAMAHGNARAEESVLLDYIGMNSIYAVWYSLKHRHKLVTLAGLTYLPTLLLQPLAGALFTIKQTPATIPVSAVSIRTLGLDASYPSLNNFLAAAGYADSAVTNNLADPPFVRGQWAIADFQAPYGQYPTGNLTVNTTGIRTDVNCTLPSAFQLIPTAEDFNISATSTSGCSVVAPIDQTSGIQQYNISLVPNCGPNPTAGNSFQPVFFWFYHRRDDNLQPEARGVFCEPYMETYNVTATLDLDRNNLTSITIGAKLDGTNSVNNITGAPLSGKAFNGAIFPPAPDAFTLGRAESIASALSGAVFRAALRTNNLQSVFDAPDGFLNLTNKVYTQDLSLVAKSTYFLPVEQDIPANLILLRPRLFVEALATYGLAAILFTVGLSGLALVAWFRHERKRIYLHAFPGSIAATLALTSRSGFGELLIPYDTEYSMKTKLDGLRFSLDKRTGAIIADDDGMEDPEITIGRERRESKMSLLGHDLSFGQASARSRSPEPYSDFPRP